MFLGSYQFPLTMVGLGYMKVELGGAGMGGVLLPPLSADEMGAVGMSSWGWALPHWERVL